MRDYRYWLAAAALVVAAPLYAQTDSSQTAMSQTASAREQCRGRDSP